MNLDKEKKKKKVMCDHYKILGLPSGEEGTKLEEKEITKAYRARALKLHPDKRPNDPNAKAKFQRLNSSYAILRDPKSRKLFDSSLRLDSKPSFQPKPKREREASEPNRDEGEDEVNQEIGLMLIGTFIFVLGPMVFPAARSGMSLSLRWLGFRGGYELLSQTQKSQLWSMVVRVGSYVKRNPPQAATNQESYGDDHCEDIEDWVMV
ncbi:hypothetical protein M0R45_023498 [Rubus argutus]|uniref:J domain-containing protein n=1 Tax=Rubus argutus TaxID=59490 RepID=A0AAW1WNM6_RUBAR